MLMLNAKKSKCLAITPRKRRWLSSQLDFCQFHGGGCKIHKLSSLVHLGHIINSELNDQKDILYKRCTFIGQVNKVLCYFPRLAAD